MGVPAFFRWLSRKYCKIVVDANEEKPREDPANGVKIPVDCTQPNINFTEFDNLYLDMNGIIHPCTHPEDRPPPKTEDEMFVLIFEYIDRLLSIVRPRRLLYMAIDGVAPRAKMNQQRSRRFRAAKEAREKQEQIKELRRKLTEEGIPLPPPRKEEEHFDSNCITPGTPFMARLAEALRGYIKRRAAEDPAWKSINVVLSDASVPGEGEHKIMDYIRKLRANPDHDPYTVHCLCGADADLIMLGLATHELNFNIIREEFVPNQPVPCDLCGQYGHEMQECKGLSRDQSNPDQSDPLRKEKNFIFIRLPILREYLQRDLAMPNLPFPYNFERAIDDWVFLCFFVGNDFLPHLPSLEIREGAIDRLIKLYKDAIYRAGGWLTENGEVHIEPVMTILKELGNVEDQIFKERQLKEVRFREQERARNERKFIYGRGRRRDGDYQTMNGYSSSLLEPRKPGNEQIRMNGEQIRMQARNDRMASAGGIRGADKPQCVETTDKLKSMLGPLGREEAKPVKRLLHESDEEAIPAKASTLKAKFFQFVKDATTGDRIPTKLGVDLSASTLSLSSSDIGIAANGDDGEDGASPLREVRLWEEGWKDRYYRLKFGVPESDEEFRASVARAYVDGLCWVLKYYYQGCVSWDWFYPYHYAPFASDFNSIDIDYRPDFSAYTEPFYPLAQLMAVFPAASKAHIPEGWRYLMTEDNSPIIDFYPLDFEIDLNGKKFAWQGVALLPFVDQSRLLLTLKENMKHLTQEDIRLNVRGKDELFERTSEIDYRPTRPQPPENGLINGGAIDHHRARAHVTDVGRRILGAALGDRVPAQWHQYPHRFEPPPQPPLMSFAQMAAGVSVSINVHTGNSANSSYPLSFKRPIVGGDSNFANNNNSRPPLPSHYHNKQRDNRYDNDRNSHRRQYNHNEHHREAAPSTSYSYAQVPPPYQQPQPIWGAYSGPLAGGPPPKQHIYQQIDAPPPSFAMPYGAGPSAMSLQFQQQQQYPSYQQRSYNNYHQPPQNSHSDNYYQQQGYQQIYAPPPPHQQQPQQHQQPRAWRHRGDSGRK